ncbi:MAG: HAD family hydrolase [Clostridiaceae bacterium]|jgi:Cof subfamily protein (haloacid dehalogenase superfamily)|nr:HAD family hydrolase [Clostridiaceae bacterium]
MKTLYISDLDGTLLNNAAEISDFTRAAINLLTSEYGVNFAVATARSEATASTILAGVNVNVPSALLNGVCIYDLKKRAYLNAECLTTLQSERIFEVFDRFSLSAFIHTIEEGIHRTWVLGEETPFIADVINKRKEKYGKVFTPVDSRFDCAGNMMYVSALGSKEPLLSAAKRLRASPGLNVIFYPDTYIPETWFLEISSATASKKTAVQSIIKKFGFDRTVCFGDNLNDLPMFSVCDERYAVRNACEDLKRKSDAVIGNNSDNGVAEFLLNRFGAKL